MREFRKSAVEPIQVELMDGTKVSLRASLWVFKQHQSGFRAEETAALSQLDTMLEFLWDCVLDKGELTKEAFLSQMPLDPTWIADLFKEVIGTASSDRPTEAAETPLPQ
jgi:hypothetical protein